MNPKSGKSNSMENLTLGKIFHSSEEMQDAIDALTLATNYEFIKKNSKTMIKTYGPGVKFNNKLIYSEAYYKCNLCGEPRDADVDEQLTKKRKRLAPTNCPAHVTFRAQALQMLEITSANLEHNHDPLSKLSARFLRRVKRRNINGSDSPHCTMDSTDPSTTSGSEKQSYIGNNDNSTASPDEDPAELSRSQGAVSIAPNEVRDKMKELLKRIERVLYDFPHEIHQKQILLLESLLDTFQTVDELDESQSDSAQNMSRSPATLIMDESFSSNQIRGEVLSDANVLIEFSTSAEEIFGDLQHQNIRTSSPFLENTPKENSINCSAEARLEWSNIIIQSPLPQQSSSLIIEGSTVATQTESQTKLQVSTAQSSKQIPINLFADVEPTCSIGIPGKSSDLQTLLPVPRERVEVEKSALVEKHTAIDTSLSFVLELVPPIGTDEDVKERDSTVTQPEPGHGVTTITKDGQLIPKTASLFDSIKIMPKRSRGRPKGAKLKANGCPYKGKRSLKEKDAEINLRHRRIEEDSVTQRVLRKRTRQ